MEKTENKFMRLAINLAQRGQGRVSPNPMVGCVIVKNGRVISTGYHQYFGGPHAEINAIRNAPSLSSIKNSTIYVNLEPCSHFNKKTPPCVPEIIKSGVKKVVISMLDPNPPVNGNGVKQLKKAGITCETGLLEGESMELNRFYVKWITQKMPYVILKWAMSLDGKIATKTGDARWVSSKESRIYSHKLRETVDAILVGVNTVLKDNPRLTVRHKIGTAPIFGRKPIRILLDPQLKAPANANIFNKEAPTIVFFNRLLFKIYKLKLDKLRHNNVNTIEFETIKNEFNFTKIMGFLAKRGISSVLIEGGGETHSLALKFGIADEIDAFISPKIVGGRNAKTPVEGEGIAKMSDALKLKSVKFAKIGDDMLIKGYLRGY